jgi:hypothetical protein
MLLGRLNTQDNKPLDGYALELTTGSTAKADIPILTKGATDTIWSGPIWAGTDVPGVAAAATGGHGCHRLLRGLAEWHVARHPLCRPDYTPQNAPTSKAEFTLVNSQDTYDITAINGINIPLEMRPTTDQVLEPTPISNDSNLKYCWCKEAGAVTVPETPDRSCPWSFDRTNHGIGIVLAQHQASARVCGPTQPCPLGQTCGIAYDSSQGVVGVYQECGTPLSGSSTAVQICAAIGYNNANLQKEKVSPELKRQGKNSWITPGRRATSRQSNC